MKHQAKSIWLARAEGRHEECIAVTLTGANLWQQANNTLLAWSESAPKDGGYNKTDFTVTYDDGETYTGVFDLKHISVEFPNLAAHVDGFVRFHAGRFTESELPEHMRNGAYAKWLAGDWTAKIVPEYAAFADGYAIGDEMPAKTTVKVTLDELRRQNADLLAALENLTASVCVDGRIFTPGQYAVARAKGEKS